MYQSSNSSSAFQPDASSSSHYNITPNKIKTVNINFLKMMLLTIL